MGCLINAIGQRAIGLIVGSLSAPARKQRAILGLARAPGGLLGADYLTVVSAATRATVLLAGGNPVKSRSMEAVKS